MAMANVSSVLRDLKARVAAEAAALVSRDGMVLFADLPGNAFVETFAIMCATMMGAAATAHDELGRATPRSIVVESDDGFTVIADAGPKAILIALVGKDRPSDAIRVEVARFADLLRTA